MANFEGRPIHLKCWEKWALKTRFVEQFNSVAEDAVVCDDASVDWLRADGSVEEHDESLYVVPTSNPSRLP
jgi:hypothetical protein